MKSLYRILWTLIAALLTASYAHAQPTLPANASKREYRAVWLTTIKGLDWPRDTDFAGQRRHLCTILDSLQAINVNTILLQTRIRGDVIYPSSIEPFSPVFTGKYGIAPDYDPLDFAITECHKRGMQLHAWIVTIPLGDATHVKAHGTQSLPAKSRIQCTKFKGSWYMEPSHPATTKHLCALAEEIVSKYDVDGIHLDYIRYPESLPLTFSYGRRTESIAKESAQRRSHISAIIRSLHSTVKRIKPWVCVSAATLGKHNDTSRYSSYGWNAFHTVHQEAQEWVREGIVDALFPMLYYAGDHFYPFVTDWHEHSCGRHIVVGMGTYQLHGDEKDWELDEIIRQLNVVRAHPIGGTAQFRSGFVTGNTKGVYDYLRHFYPHPTLPPSLVWEDSVPPTPPHAVEMKRTASTVTLRWAAPKEGDVISYNIYCHHIPTDSTANTVHLMRAALRDTIYHSFNCGYKYHYTVTAIDRYGNESLPAVFSTSTTPPAE